MSKANIDNQTKKIIVSVHKFLTDEAIGGIKKVKSIQSRTAKATGISESTITRIKRLTKIMEPAVAFRTPGRHKAKLRPMTGHIDYFDQGIIKRSVHNYYKTEREPITVKRLHAKMKAAINYPGSPLSLCSLMSRDLGFRWKRSNRDFAALEKPVLRFERLEYLRKMKQYREEDRPMVYVAVAKNRINGGGPSFLVARAWSDSTAPDKKLFVLKSPAEGQDMSDSFVQNWLVTELLPLLPPRSVVVCDKVPYQNKLITPTPSCISPKADMEKWLADRGVAFEEGLHKSELHALVTRHRRAHEVYFLDQLLLQDSHTALRLPPFHPDLNPIKIAASWGLLEMEDEAWAGLCSRVVDAEEQYRQSESSIDEMTDSIGTGLADDESDYSEDDVSDASDSDAGAFFGSDSD